VENMREISHILVPVDFEKHTGKLVEFAIYIAEKLSAEITLLFITETLGPFAGFAHTSIDIAAAELHAYYEKKMINLLEDIKKQFPRCNGDVVEGNIVDEIIAFAQKENVDLIVIGTHGSKGIEKIMMGSVAERVVKLAPCPTLTLNPYI
jgi:nucleotide-binding universal stress UspA family protein